MVVDNLKELQKLIKACRALGVDKIEIDGIKLELGALPSTRKAHKLVTALQEANEFHDIGGIGASTPVPQPDLIHMPDALTPEQLLNWSSQSVEPVEA